MLYTKSANSKTASAAPMRLLPLTTLPAVALPLVDGARVIRNHSSWTAVENKDSDEHAAREGT